MADHKIFNCAPGNEEDDVVTLRGLSAYYRRGTALDMHFNKISELAPETYDSNAFTLRQAQSFYYFEN